MKIGTFSPSLSLFPVAHAILRLKKQVLLVDTQFSALGVDGSRLPAADAAAQVFLPEAFWAHSDEN